MPAKLDAFETTTKHAMHSQTYQIMSHPGSRVWFDAASIITAYVQTVLREVTCREWFHFKSSRGRKKGD